MQKGLGIFAVTIGLLIGCGKQNVANHLAGSESEPATSGRILLIAHGGYNSCAVEDAAPGEILYGQLPGQEKASEPELKAAVKPNAKPEPRKRNTPWGNPMFDRLLKLVDKMSGSGRQVEWIATCYGLLGNIDDHEEVLFVVRSGDPDVTARTSRTALWSFLRHSFAGVPAYLLGHSHGGWTALKTFSLAGLQVLGLVTVDAISVPGCQFANPFSEACTQFPPDVSATTRATIANLVEQWLNFFQVKSKGLHSSRVDEADNKDRQKIDEATHSSIDEATEVWQAIGKMIQITWPRG